MAQKNMLVGRKPVLEALLSHKKLDIIYVLSSLSGEWLDTLYAAARASETPIKKVPAAKLNRLTRVVHQGVVAFGALVSYANLQDIIDFALHEGRAPFFLLLDAITDTRNVGAIVRTAYCQGVDALVIAREGNAPLREEALKTSAGALLSLPICRVINLQNALHTLHLNGVHTFCASLDADARALYDCDLRVPSAVVLGAEDTGVAKSIAKHTHERLKIPMYADFDSLNVSAAAAMICYEKARQRRA